MGKLMLYLGPYVWNTLGNPVGWYPPANSTPVVDLRSLPMQAQAGGAAQGFGVFEGPSSLPAEYMPLGSGPDVLLRTAQRRDWAIKLGFSSPMEGRSIIEAIWETLTWRADPQGQDNAKPLMPTSRRVLELNISGVVRRTKFSPAMREFDSIRSALQQDYRRIRAAVLDSPNRPVNERLPAEHHLKVLDAWRDKYRVDYRVFIPSDLPDEGIRPRSTTITESFDQADSDTLGPDLSWTELAEGFETISNKAVLKTTASGNDLARADSDLSSADHYAQVELGLSTSGSEYRGVMIRKDSTSTLSYYHGDKLGKTNASWRSFRRVTGTYTAIGSDTTQTQSAGDVIKLEHDGSNVVRYRNGVQQDSTPDTNITGNLRCGIVANIGGSGGGGTNTIDNFEAADLAAAAAGAFPSQTLALQGVGI